MFVRDVHNKYYVSFINDLISILISDISCYKRNSVTRLLSPSQSEPLYVFPGKIHSVAIFIIFAESLMALSSRVHTTPRYT